MGTLIWKPAFGQKSSEESVLFNAAKIITIQMPLISKLRILVNKSQGDTTNDGNRYIVYVLVLNLIDDNVSLLFNIVLLKS